MKRDLKLERVFPQAPDRVWRALTEPRAIATWLMDNDFQPVLGHRFTFRAKPQPGWDGVTYCEVIELEPPRRLAYTWRGGDGKAGPPTLDTIVRFTLAPAGTGTRLTLEHTGFSGLKSVLVSFMMKAGWQKMLARRFGPAVDALA
jgi:uncharacterized protein YndB with AHSA1/START domain